MSEMDFTQIGWFIFEDDERKGPLFVVKTDGPSKGEVLFAMHENDVNFAQELVKRFNQI
jgi:hypothetical protein